MEKGSGKKERVGSMSGFRGRALACRETEVMPVWSVKGCTVIIARYGGGVAVFRQRKHKEVRGSRGTGNNEEESLIHFLGLAFGL